MAKHQKFFDKKTYLTLTNRGFTTVIHMLALNEQTYRRAHKKMYLAQSVKFKLIQVRKKYVEIARNCPNQKTK